MMDENLDPRQRIVPGEPSVPEGSGEPVRVYPRDISDAFRVTWSIGRGGVMPEGCAARAPLPAGGKEEGKPAMPPPLPLNANFTPAMADSPEGTLFTAKVERNGETVDGEAEE